MNIPQFNAEASLGPIMGIYRGKTVAGGPERSEISMQQFGGLSAIWYRLECCGYSQLLHRFYCISQIVSVFDRCKCRRFPNGPIILCDPLVIETYPLEEADRITSRS